MDDANASDARTSEQSVLNHRQADFIISQVERARHSLRATSIIARTLYKELRRARYSLEDVMRLIGELIELVTIDNQRQPDTAPVAFPHLVDPETGLPDEKVMMETLAFELRHLSQCKSGVALAVLCLDVELPSWCACESIVYDRIGPVLRSLIRPGDSIGRLTKNRYLLVLPNFAASDLDAFKTRLRTAFHRDILRQYEQVRVELGGILEHRARSAPSDLVQACIEGREPLIPSRCVAVVQLGNDRIPKSARADHAMHSTRTGLVLALGGGAARAVAHVGLMRALRRAGINILGVSGTSAGALVGAMHAAGMEEQAIVERFTEFSRASLYRQMRKAYASYCSASRNSSLSKRLYRDTGIAHISENMISAVPNELYWEFIEYFVGPDQDIASLKIPFSACATDLTEGRLVRFSLGSLHDALRAACAAPGLFAPQVRDKRLLVDGAPTADLPIDAARHLALPAPILGVVLEHRKFAPRSVTNSAEIFSRYMSLVHAELAREQFRRLDFIVQVPVQQYGWFNFREAKAIAELGEATMDAALKSLLPRLASWQKSELQAEPQVSSYSTVAFGS